MLYNNEYLYKKMFHIDLVEFNLPLLMSVKLSEFVDNEDLVFGKIKPTVVSISRDGAT